MNELILLMTIAGRRCALRAEDVQSVIEVGHIVPIPLAPASVVGMAALRSQALTVLDCRRAIGFEPADHATDIRAALVSVEGHSYALRVDSVEDVTEAMSEPEMVNGGFGAQWTAVSRGKIETPSGPALLLDIAALVALASEDQAEAA